MSTMSQFFGGGGGGVGLGQAAYFPMYSGSNANPSYSPVIIGDEVYLRSGSYTSVANADASVQQMPHLQLFDTVQSASQVCTSGRATLIASNGAGTCVAIGAGNNNNVSYSTNNGVTWTNIGVGTGGAWSFVVWTGQRFVLGNTGGPSTAMIFQSTNGSTWTAGTGTLPPSGMACTSLITNGAGRVLFLANDFTGWASADHGVTWTSFANNTIVAQFGFALGSVWVFFRPSDTTAATAPLATPGTQTFYTLPFSVGVPNCVSNNSNLGVVSPSGSPLVWVTTDGLNWVQQSTVSQTVSNIFWNGSAFYFSQASGGGVPYTSAGTNFLPYDLFKTVDFASFTDTKLVPRLVGNVALSGQARLAGVGSDGRVFWASTNPSSVQTTNVRYWQETTTPDFVGTNVVTTIASSSVSTPPLHQTYWRIK
jgi:hypothetical protein